MKKQVQQWTGIPVSVGIAYKGLAKIANKIAKNTAIKPLGYLMATDEQRVKALNGLA